MKLQNIVAAMALSAVIAACPHAAESAALANNLPNDLVLGNGGKARVAKSSMLLAANGSSGNPLMQPSTPESLGVPSLMELNQEIDKNNTVIEKKPLPDFQLSPSTKKIIKNLPKNLSGKRAPATGKAELKTSDFNGREEADQPTSASRKSTQPNAKKTAKKDSKDADATAALPGQPGFVPMARSNSLFEIEVSDTVKQIAPDELLMGSKAYAVGQYESAIAIYKNVLKKSPDNRDALFGLATSYHRNGQKDQAKVFYAKLLQEYPNDTEGQNNFLSLVAEEAPDDALREFNELAKVNPGYAPIYAHKAMIYIKNGDDENAIKNLYQALKISGDNEYKYNLAILFDRNGYYDNAARLYSDLMEDSYKGVPIPASRSQISERIIFLKTMTNNNENEKKN